MLWWPLHRATNSFFLISDTGLLIVADGDGRRTIKPVETNLGEDTQSIKSSNGASKGEILELLVETLGCDQPRVQRPVLLLADSLGRCIPQTDSVLFPVVRDDYPFGRMAEDVASGRIPLDHKIVIIWSGAAYVGQDTSPVFADLKALINIIRVKNRDIQVYVSTILPQPRDQRNLQSKIAAFNSELKTVVADFKAVKSDVVLLQSHLIYLDDKLDIVRPIVANFEDGYHLNLHGTHRLRQFWLNELGLSK